MARTYSRRLLDGHQATVGKTISVPAGRVWVVRVVDALSDPATAGAAVGLAVANPGLIWLASVPAGQTIFYAHLDTRQVLEAGESLGFSIFTGTWNYAISGYELNAE